ncbi:MAG: SIS domain-containing protein [Candidatus Omnitrophota bacterium]
MKQDIKQYFGVLKSLFDEVIVTAEGGVVCQFNEAIKMAVELILDQAGLGGKVLFVGNGASAAISSHMATDFWKNAGVKALSFNDSSLLTCISNDFGYKHVFEKPVEMFAESEDVLVAISSSGESENILNAVSAAKKIGLKIVTLSGFKDNNPLRKMGDINFYMPSVSYGHVEITHLSVCHCMSDIIKVGKNG